jgi:hypothetical protein
VEWTTTHLFVPNSLIGAGILARFPDALIARFKAEGVDEIRVVLEEDSAANNNRLKHDGTGGDNGQTTSPNGFRPDPAAATNVFTPLIFTKAAVSFTCHPGKTANCGCYP